MSMYTVKGFDYPFERVNCDAYGNPRYVLHFRAFADTYEKAWIIANRIGWSVYRAKSHSRCFVGQSYSIQETAKHINDFCLELQLAEVSA